MPKRDIICILVLEIALCLKIGLKTSFEELSLVSDSSTFLLGLVSDSDKKNLRISF